MGSLLAFVNGFYKNYPEESIPLPKSPFDDLVQLCVDYIQEYPLIVGGCAVVFLFLCLGFFFLLRSEEPKNRKSKTKKNKDQDNGVDSGKKTKSSKKDN